MIKRLTKVVAVFVLLLLLAIMAWPEVKHSLYTPPADYLESSAAYTLPPMPDSWQYDYFTATDGKRLRWGQTDNADDAKATVVLLPGYTSSLDMYGDHISRLLARGYHVVGFDLRGQGGSERERTEQPEKLYAAHFGVYSTDVAQWLAQQSFGDDRPVIILGSSFGGHVALRLVGDHNPDVDGLVLLAPAYRPNTAPLSYGLTKVIVGLSRALGKDKHFAAMQSPWRPDGLDLTAPSDCSFYPERLYLRDTLYVRDPAQRVGGVTNNYLWGLMTSGEVLQTDAFAAKITVPTIMVAAENDVIIDSKVSENSCKNSLPQCTLKVYPGTGHCLTLENDAVQERIIDEVDTVLAMIGDTDG